MEMQMDGAPAGAELASDRQFISVMRQGLEVRNTQSFEHWMNDSVAGIFNARYWSAVTGRVNSTGVAFDRHIHRTPPGYFRKIMRDGQIASPMVPRWHEQQRPLLFTLDAPQASTDWERNFIEYGLRAVLGHGQVNPEGSSVSHFSFRYEDPLDPSLLQRLELLVPHLHAAIFRIESQAPCTLRPPNRLVRLTRAEQEVIRWLCLGKTNSEIAIITDRSVRTVNNQVAGMLAKLSLFNRVQLVVWALRTGCVEDL